MGFTEVHYTDIFAFLDRKTIDLLTQIPKNLKPSSFSIDVDGKKHN